MALSFWFSVLSRLMSVAAFSSLLWSSRWSEGESSESGLVAWCSRWRASYCRRSRSSWLRRFVTSRSSAGGLGSLGTISVGRLCFFIWLASSEKCLISLWLSLRLAALPSNCDGGLTGVVYTAPGWPPQTELVTVSGPLIEVRICESARL